MRRHYRLDSLATDARAMDQIAHRLAGIIGHIRHVAGETSDHLTGERLTRLAEALADTCHDGWSDVMDAHERAADEERSEPLYVLDAEIALCFGLPLTPDALAKVEAAVKVAAA